VIRKCKKCGFILGTRPNLKDIDGVCSACINYEKKKSIDFASRQEWLTKYILENKTNSKYDCLVAVSGGKDSTVIVKKLFENHGVKRALLFKIVDEFTATKAGITNLNNIVSRYNCDLLTYRINPQRLAEHMRNDLIDNLNPLKYLEEQIYKLPLEIAKNNNIKLLFYGENAEFEYGSSEELDIFHPASTDDIRVIYMGAIYPYSAPAWYAEAKEVGFLDLDHFNEWQRQGTVENYSQIDSIGYHMGIWTKFVKFGFQRVSDIACRLVRDGMLTYEQAQQLIKDKDYICDPMSKRDMCRVIGITEEFFDEMVDRHANCALVVQDISGVWRRKDMVE
jgi:hypothetical protein